jgi:acyl dehydratase
LSELLHYEDIPVDVPFAAGPKLVTREEVIAFAREYDPQTFHLDDTAAAQSHFGRISASGWHTCGMMMRLFVDQVLNRVAMIAGGEVNELRWRRPVYPGDTLTARFFVTAKRISTKRPDMGILSVYTEGFNQDEEVVISHKTTIMVKVREPAGNGG